MRAQELPQAQCDKQMCMHAQQRCAMSWCDRRCVMHAARPFLCRALRYGVMAMAAAMLRT